eukprot:scaffold14534_cov29-Prasinocladus_malaysianus.AAC.1
MDEKRPLTCHFGLVALRRAAFSCLRFPGWCRGVAASLRQDGRRGLLQRDLPVGARERPGRHFGHTN